VNANPPLDEELVATVPLFDVVVPGSVGPPVVGWFALTLTASTAKPAEPGQVALLALIHFEPAGTVTVVVNAPELFVVGVPSVLPPSLIETDSVEPKPEPVMVTGPPAALVGLPDMVQPARGG
jgi:hypothetical protein